MRNEVRNSTNNIIGFIEDMGNDIIATHIRTGYVGKYSKSSDITFDKRGNIFCYGESLRTLVLNEDQA